MTALEVNCPVCKRPVQWTRDSKFRPFCSERCQLIDLGAWADGSRYIPADPDQDDSHSSDLEED